MEEPHRRQERDLNDLLKNGYFKTTRARSPASINPRASAPAFLTTPQQHYHQHHTHRERSKSLHRHRYTRPPPPPSVEDEAESLAKESSAPSTPSDDDPLVRGHVDQRPVIIEADVTEAEAARLHEEDSPRRSMESDNQERRFIFVPQGKQPHPQNIHYRKEDGRERVQHRPPFDRRDTGKKEEKRDHLQQPQIPREKSRRDLPSLQTKIPKAIPPAFRRSASAYEAVPRDLDDTLKIRSPRTPSGGYLLSPGEREVLNSAKSHMKDFFSSSPSTGSRHQNATFTDRSEKRNSAGSFTTASGPPSPVAERRSSGLESPSKTRPIYDHGRPKPLVDLQDRRNERPPSRQSDRHSGSDNQRSSKSKKGRYYSSSEDGSPESDTEKHERIYKARPRDYFEGALPPIKDDRHIRSSSRSHRPSFGSKQPSKTSPLHSPKSSPRQSFSELEKAETIARDRKGRERPRAISPSDSTPRQQSFLAPVEGQRRTRSRARSSSRRSDTGPYEHKYPTQSAASLQMPMPSPRVDLHGPGSSLASPAEFDEKRQLGTRPPLESRPSWHPPPFQPPPHRSGLDKPHGAYRRYSEEVDSGSIAPLPSCPRTNFTRGRNDWLTLPSCPSFNICPSCYHAAVFPTEFRDSFLLGPRRPPDIAIACDFGSLPWYRIGWLLIRKERHKDLRIFHGLANVVETAPPCLGKHEAMRQWHSIIDPKTGNPIKTFSVCYSCVKSIEALLPPLKGIFIRTTDPQNSTPRTCDLRFDSSRFIQYFDTLETTADHALEAPYHAADTRALASLVRRKTAIEECQQDTDLLDRRWYFPPNLPELTVCEECFEDVVWPEKSTSSASSSPSAAIADTFPQSPQRLQKASCQLYSAKMRGFWRRALDTGDWKLLVGIVRQRRAAEVDFKSSVGVLKRREGWRENERVLAEVERLQGEWRRWNAGA